MSTLAALPEVVEQEPADEERQRNVWDHYEQEILKAVNDDQWIPYTPDFFDKIRAEVSQRCQAKQPEKTA
jgi:hypothetical protein